MTPGFFDAQGRPLVGLSVTLRNLAFTGFVYFIIDTGAEVTALGPVDALNMGIPADSLRNPASWATREDVFGVGEGTVSLAIEDATYEFSVVEGPPVIIDQSIRLFLLTEGTGARRSLLGMDVLRHFDLFVGSGVRLKHRGSAPDV